MLGRDPLTLPMHDHGVADQRTHVSSDHLVHDIRRGGVIQSARRSVDSWTGVYTI